MAEETEDPMLLKIRKIEDLLFHIKEMYFRKVDCRLLVRRASQELFNLDQMMGKQR